jgi:Fe(3+) dicitrate transport protein
MATRQSLGNLVRINQADEGGNRTMIDGEFHNIGNETRLLHRYTLSGKQNALVLGFRIYKGTSYEKQGDGNNNAGPDFYFLHPENPENSNYKYPNENYAVFAENIFDLSPTLSLTPGIRFENIKTYADGFYKQRVLDAAGNVVVENIIQENQSRKRSFILMGLGISYKPSGSTEVYGNIAQNYRALNFSDLRIVNQNIVVDPSLQDEKGYTADLGIKGQWKNVLTYEATAFYLAYKGKIGQVLRTDTVLYNDYRFRGNISDARNMGIEVFGELNISKWRNPSSAVTWSVFVNGAVIDARYVHTQDASIRNHKVEMVPPLMLRTGTTFRHKNFSSTLQFSHTAKHFSDASNAEWTASAIEGIIPSYQVVDLSASYNWKMLTLEASCNNLLNEKYFTRRAESYPGPGIIPSDGRGFYATLQLKLGK